MSIYDTPVDKLQFEDIHALEENKAVENLRLEFKREWPSQKTGETRLMHQICALANTFGGWIVFGVDEAKGHGPAKLVGCAEVTGFVEKVNAKVLATISPPADVVPSRQIVDPQNPEKHYYVLYVPMSYRAPHFVTDRGGCWIRFADQRKGYDDGLAVLPEMRDLMERRKEAVRYRAHLVNSCLQIEDSLFEEAGTEGGPLASFTWIVVPELPRAQQRSTDKLRGLAMNIVHGTNYHVPTVRESASYRKLIFREREAELQKSAPEPNFYSQLLQVGLDGEIALTYFLRFGPEQPGRSNYVYPVWIPEWALYLWDFVDRSSRTVGDVGRYVCIFRQRNAQHLRFRNPPGLWHSFMDGFERPLSDCSMSWTLAPWTMSKPEAQRAFIRDATFDLYLGLGLTFAKEFPWLGILKHSHEQNTFVKSLLTFDPEEVDPEEVLDSTAYTGEVGYQ